MRSRPLIIMGELLLFAGSLMLNTCGDDAITNEITMESDTIPGNFTGTYTITEDFGTSSQEEHTQPIVWIFTVSTYKMYIDTTKEYNPNFMFCRVDGQYYMSNGVVYFKELHSIPYYKVLCNDILNPRDWFTLVKSNNADTLRMTQYVEDEQMMKEIFVVRQE